MRASYSEAVPAGGGARGRWLIGCVRWSPWSGGRRGRFSRVGRGGRWPHRVLILAPWEDRSAPHPAALATQPRNHAGTAERIRGADPNDPPRAPFPASSGLRGSLLRVIGSHAFRQAGRARRTVFSASSGRTAPPWPATAAARVFSASSGRATPSSRQAGRLLRVRGQRGPVRGPGCSPWPPSVRGPRRRRLSKSATKAWISPGRRKRNVDIPRFFSPPIPPRRR